MDRFNERLRCALIFLFLLALQGCLSDRAGTHPASGTEIRALSNRADLVSGGDVLLEIVLPEGTGYAALEVARNGEPVTNSFAKGQDGRILGVVSGLVDGANTITARAAGNAARLVVTNHPQGGPVFSGPQVQPWVCATPEAREGDDDTPFTVASGLSTEATNEKCDIAAEVKYYYRTTGACGRDPANPRNFIPCYREYDAAHPPADLAMTTNLAGREIPFIVRVERGTLNRGIYDIAVVEEAGAKWGPFEKSSTWNGGIVHIFGGSTGTPHRQYPPNSRWWSDEALSRGFIVSVSSLTDQALNSNKVVAAETVMMLKEHVVETYGEVSRTIGSGCSGGSIMQLVIAGTYPGILDGIQPSCTYPDSVTTGIEVTECVLLENYFASDDFAAVTSGLDADTIEAHKAAIAGHEDSKSCVAWKNSFGHSNNPGNFVRNGEEMNNCYLPRTWVYDPESNPQGVRCSQSDHEIAQWGFEPGHDYGRRVNDNTGVLYGLAAVEAGTISPEEFVVLNEKIGGSDVDRGPVPERMRASADSEAAAYRMGFVTDPRQWAKTPIIDLRGNDNSGIHMNWRAFAVRDRLDRTLSRHDSQVIWRYGPGLGVPSESTLVADALETMDSWVMAIKADKRDLPIEAKVVVDKPQEAFDFCYIGDDYEHRITDWARCDADPVLRYYGSPRQVAGGPLAENIWKCELKPLARGDFTTQFSDAQWQRLGAVFADGVCDWSRPGVGAQPAVPWLDYSGGPGGKPLPQAPVSTPM